MIKPPSNSPSRRIFLGGAMAVAMPRAPDRGVRAWSRPRLSADVRRVDDGLESERLGRIVLNECALAACGALDGDRTISELAALLAETYAVDADVCERDLVALFEHLTVRRFVVVR